MNDQCEYCKKDLSEDKGELDHGCLDCGGFIYNLMGEWRCVHCIDNQTALLQKELEQVKADRDICRADQDIKFNLIMSHGEQLKILKRENEKLKNTLELYDINKESVFSDHWDAEENSSVFGPDSDDNGEGIYWTGRHARYALKEIRGGGGNN